MTFAKAAVSDIIPSVS